MTGGRRVRARRLTPSWCGWTTHGAEILMEPTDFEYGERQYAAQDPAGHQWTFSETLADVAPEEWGGTTVSAR
jgi:uncharacterized glyoxalase superfamily protein PhnB